MTTTTRDLAGRAQQVAKRSDGMARVAANCVFVALSYSPSVDVARAALGELGGPDLREAAIRLLEELVAEVSK